MNLKENTFCPLLKAILISLSVSNEHAWNGYMLKERCLHKYNICRNSKYPIMCEPGVGKERLQWQDGVGNIQVRIFGGGKYSYSAVQNIWRWEILIFSSSKYSAVGNIQGCKIFGGVKYLKWEILMGDKYSDE